MRGSFRAERGAGFVPSLRCGEGRAVAQVLDVGPHEENLVPAAVPRARGVPCGFLEID